MNDRRRKRSCRNRRKLCGRRPVGGDSCLRVGKKACRRQIDDLKRQDFEYRYDEKKAARVCGFIEKLPHIKGKWAKAGGRIELQPWQVFILTTVFGWVSKETGLRRFKTVYLEMPRKNGKSSVSSGVGIYCCCADGESGGEIYSAATTRDQAKIVWQDAWHMVERSPGLKAAFGVSTTAHAISQVRTASRFQALSAEGNSLDDIAQSWTSFMPTGRGRCSTCWRPPPAPARSRYCG